MVQPTTVGTVDSIADLRVVDAGTPATAPVFTTVSVKGYHAPGDGGGGMFRFTPSVAAAVNDGTVINWTNGTGRWVRIVEGGRNYDFRWFGAKGDAVTDDTAACQATIDAAMPASVGVEFSCGDYLVGPLYGNGTAWKNGDPEHDPPIPPMAQSGGQPSVLSFRGQGRAPFLCRLIAKPGAYAAGQAVITFRNVAGKEVGNFSVESNNVADCSVDVRWVGTATGDGGGAPSCNNTFTDLWSYRANRTHFDMRQAADTLVSNLHAEGGTAPIGFDFRLGGGGIWMDNCFSAIDAKLLLASQNAGIQNCGFFGGIEITDQSLNYVHFDSCHLYPHTPKRTLAVSPLATVKDSANLVITLGPHGLKVGNYIEIFGAVDVGGVSANSYINTDPDYTPGTKAAPHKITAVTDTTVTVVMKETNGNPHQATSTATGGGAAGAVSIIGRGYTVESNITGGASGSRMLKFTACWFNVMGPLGQKYFGGRWVGGARFEACRFGAPTQGNFSDALCYFDLDNWSVAGNDGAPPLFKFDGCSFASTGGRPASVEGQVLVGFEHRMDNFPSSIAELEWPGDVQLPRSSFNKSRIRFGTTGYLWKDNGDLLRYTSSAPSGDDDGNVLVQRQSGLASPVNVVEPAHQGAEFVDGAAGRLWYAFIRTVGGWTEYARRRDGAGSPIGAVTPSQRGTIYSDTTAGGRTWIGWDGANSNSWDIIPRTITGSEVKVWGSIGGGVSVTEQVTVTGAVFGDHATAAMSISLQGLMMTAYVSAANTVTVVLFNPTTAAVNLASGTLTARVMRT